jgi:putative transposon-encoded protein
MEKAIIELPKALVEGYLLPKEVKVQGTSGAIYLPKEFIGKKFKVFLIPIKGYNEKLLSFIREKYPEVEEEFKNGKTE